MNIEHRRTLQLFLVVALSLIPGWAQTAAKNAKSKQQLAMADNPTSSSVSTTGMNPKDMEQFVIGSNDVLAVDVWKEPEVSHTVSVRSDGKISLALIGEIEAAGKTPKQLETDIANGLRSYISDPEVTVIIQAMNSKKYNILGRVGHAGSFPLTAPTTILDAIAGSGGFQDFAKRKKIYVLRTAADGREVRIPFNYTEVIKGKHPEQNIQLQAHDTIVVP
jgi:polysaccharide export outer membrane protein